MRQESVERVFDLHKPVIVYQTALELYPSAIAEKQEVVWKQYIQSIDESCCPINPLSAAVD